MHYDPIYYTTLLACPPCLVLPLGGAFAGVVWATYCGIVVCSCVLTVVVWANNDRLYQLCGGGKWKKRRRIDGSDGSDDVAGDDQYSL